MSYSGGACCLRALCVDYEVAARSISALDLGRGGVADRVWRSCHSAAAPTFAQPLAWLRRPAGGKPPRNRTATMERAAAREPAHPLKIISRPSFPRHQASPPAPFPSPLEWGDPHSGAQNGRNVEAAQQPLKEPCGLPRPPPALCHSQTKSLKRSFGFTVPMQPVGRSGLGGDEFQRCSCRWKDSLANRCL